jgi:hypothetical protein
MNFTQGAFSLIDPTHGLLSLMTRPDKAAGAASKSTMKAAGMIPGFGAMTKVFNKEPNTAGLKNKSSTYVQVNGAGYDGTIQSVKGKAANGLAASMKPARSSMGGLGCGMTFPKSLCDFRKLKAPNALDSELAGML